MNFLISKKDLPEFVQFSENTPDHLVNPYIKDAWLFDVQPALLEAEQRTLVAYTKLDTERKAELASYAELTLEEITLLPAEDQQALKEHQLFEAVRAWFALETYRRLFTYHGFHVTPRGVEFFNEGGQPVPSAQRNEMKQDILDKRNHYRALFEKQLKAYRPLPTTPCGCPPRRTGRQSKGGLQFHAI
ncbi:hypothetical protein [Hymenobacter sp. GOD-10R]|uniref:hypothetical protein n=1 Tax=Hymenobacter sp. GOD-10R TaxID=3093922 RepID=UPI002D76D222|nr:hypothetical protein [Hymenobacter sp. GOD-10R]WRQ26671.1 hypothetical protein SD425_16485 [Hymenobacter sp. GOD-10R]